MQALKFLTSFISVSDCWIADKIICAVLLNISAALAYKIGGDLEVNGKIGRFVWLVVAIVLYVPIALIIKGSIWLFSTPTGWIVSLAVSVLVGFLVMIVKNYQRKRCHYD